MSFFLNNWDKEKYPIDLTGRLRALRAYFGYSTEVMAALIGVPKSTLGRWETGQAIPDYFELLRIIHLTKCNGCWLLFNQDGMFNDIESNNEELKYTIALQKRIIANLESELSAIKSLELVSQEI